MHRDSTPSRVERHWTVTVYIVVDDRVALRWHRRLGMLLPPGGHLEPNELPDDAARREALEETGLAVTLDEPDTPFYPNVSWSDPLTGPRPLARPAAIQLVPGGDGHDHIDILYRARPAVDESALPPLTDAFRWYTAAEAETYGAPPDVVAWIRRLTARG
ncbi:MAG: NUDIX domain-containing protein [Dehalococcoidia bacterium]|nr:NUDIX domain-containing protein [Dehalococcoidia bacterium]